MSHITEVKTQFKLLDDLEAVATELGGVFRRGQTTHKTYGRFVGDSAEGRQFVEQRGTAAIGKCEHAIRLADHHDGDYEVGVVKALDGSESYNLVYDAWGPGQRLERAFGKGLKKIRREYAAKVATRTAQETLSRHGWRAVRHDLPDGRIHLELQKR